MTVAALGRVRDLAPTTGAGAQHVFAGLEQFNIISREDVVLSRMRNINIKKLTDSQLKEVTKNVGRMSFEQAWQNALFTVQEFSMKVMIGIADMVGRFGNLIPAISLGMTALGVLSSVIVSVPVILSRILGTLMFIAGKGNLAAGGSALSSRFGSMMPSFVGPLTPGKESVRTGLGRAAGAAAFMGKAFRVMSVLGLFTMGVQALAGLKGVAAGQAPDFLKDLANSPGLVGDEYLDAFNKDHRDSKAQRQESIKIQEEQLGIMRGGLSTNPSESPLYALTAEMSRNILGLNRLVELAEDGNDMARGTLNNSVLNKPIGILKPGG